MKKAPNDLYIWQASVDLAVQIIQMTDKFPSRHRFGLVQQMQRAAISVPSNISEGKGRLTAGELRVFLGHARGSLYELEAQFEIAKRLHLVTEGDAASLEHTMAKIGGGISKLLDRVRRTDNNPPKQLSS